MTLLEELFAHKGGLVLLKSELFWHGGRGWDGVHDRICLLIDAAAAVAVGAAAAVAVGAAAAATTTRAYRTGGTPAALLLIDGCPHWVWVGADDLELL